MTKVGRSIVNMAVDNDLHVAKSLIESLVTQGEVGYKIYRVKLDGPPGVTYEGYSFGRTEQEAIEGAIETMCLLRSNDFDSAASEVTGD